MEEEIAVRQRLNITLILVGIFSLALFIRAFFAYDLALRDFLVSGGSDAYYYAWINEYIATTGNHLVHDQMLNFPVGMNNPRPPVYAWSVTLSGFLVGYFQGSIELGIWQSFLFSTALWGALTIFPTYFLAKEIFGRRAGMVAAFFLAVLPAHIQRTPLSNGDHDALVLFFVVTAFYFYIKALAELKERTWIAKWYRPREVYDGFKGLVLENRRTILYAVMSGTSLATIALTWQGWAYAPVIVIGYFLVQLVVHKVRNKDPLGILMVYGVVLGVALLLAAPYYVSTGFVRTWFDVPLFLYAIALGLGALFTVFHRLPWMLVIPPVILGFGGGLAIASLYSPTVAATLSSGFGYFVPNKVFETIAEAQPPEFSLAMSSFGVVTSWLSLVGIAIMAVHFVRRPRPDYLFAMAWGVAAIYMAMSAVRFIFNASPAFAITSAWVAVLIVERLGFTDVRKAIATTGGSRWTALRKGVKLRHIAGAFFVAGLVIIPNVWSGVDAAVPFEKKRDLDLEVYRATPEFLRPAGYQEGAELFYFGAFGYSLPLRTRYFPTAWEWLREQDADTFPLTSRPAFLSWWDYGFEAIQEGRHPAVADNFQNGYEYAGHFLLSQSENEGLAVLNTRLLHGEVIPGASQFTPEVVQILEERGLDPAQIRDVILRPAVYIPLIRSDPDRFGEWDTRISAVNARVIFLKSVLTEELDLDEQAALYRDLTRATGNAVHYFAVDSRLVPFSGTNTGIFYAPAKLTDHRTAELPDLRSIPIDFYRLIAETDRGEFLDLDKVPPTATITNIHIEYREPFYNTLLYRIFFGIRGSDIGEEDDGLPGLTGALSTEAPIHGWMLKHFRLVYRTAYFNPFPPDEVAEHPEAWEAVNFLDALELQDRIQRGELEATVDLSPSGNLAQGVVILKYYDGALMRGRVLGETGAPLEGVRVTALDELGTPHDFVETEDDGFYEVTLPFGEARVVASVGQVDNRTHVGRHILGEKIVDVSEGQGIGASTDIDGDGHLDIILEEDFVVKAGTAVGVAFRDNNDNSVHDPEEEGVPGLQVELRGLNGGVVGSVTTENGGEYELGNLLPGDYTIHLVRHDEQLMQATMTLTLGQQIDFDLPISVSRMTGTVTNELGEPAVGTVIELLEEVTGIRQETTADASGNYSFEGLIRGNFTLNASLDGRGAIPQRARVLPGTNTTVDVTVRPMVEFHGRTLLSFRPTTHVTINLHSPRAEPTISFTSDSTGHFSVRLPEGTYSAYSLHFEEGRAYAFLSPLTVMEEADLEWQVNLLPAVRVTGTVQGEDGNPAEDASVTFEREGAPLMMFTGQEGSFLAHLPPGPYRVWSLSESEQHASSLVLSQPTTLEIELTAATQTAGRVFYDLNGNGIWDSGEGLEGVRIDLMDSAGDSLAAFTELEGEYGLPLLEVLEYTLTIEENGFDTVSLGPLKPSALAELREIQLIPEFVRVEGQLVSGTPLEFDRIRVRFEAVGHGAQTVEVAADSQGSFAADVFPGLYVVVVDTDLAEGIKVQNAEPTTRRISVGESVIELPLVVVSRVTVEGYLTIEGEPFAGVVVFSGPEVVSTEVAGSFSHLLQPGNYSLYAVSESGAQKYVLMEHLTISSPTNVSAPPANITSLALATVLSGNLQVDGVNVAKGMTLEFLREDGAFLTTLTEESGEYEITLGPGSYQVSLDWRGVDTLDKNRRFVRYALDQEVELPSVGAINLDLRAIRTLDNATVAGSVLLSGQLASARITFSPASETAITAASDALGLYEVAIAPGSYNVYAYRETGRTVSLSRIVVAPYVDNTLDVVLEPGLLVSGVADLQGTGNEEVAIQFEAAASVNFTSDDSGLFRAYLPADTYNVTATTQRLERGVEVDYTTLTSLELQERTVLNLLLRRVDAPEIELEWDESERVTILPGGQVVYTVSVTNVGTIDDEYVFEGGPNDWSFEFEPSRLSLPFGQGNVATVRVTITAPEDAEVEHSPIFIEATSKADLGVSGVVQVELDIVHLRDVDLRLSGQPPALSPGALEYQVQVVNSGNGQDDFTLTLLNSDNLLVRGWKPVLIHEDQGQNLTVENITIPAAGSGFVTLRLEAVGPVSTTKAFLSAHSQTDEDVRATFGVQLSFPSLDIPADGIDVKGRNIQLTPPEFPFLSYGLIAAVGVVAVFLFMRRRRARGRRR